MTKFTFPIALVLALGVLGSSAAWAGKVANLECRIYSSQSSIPSKVQLRSGMRDTVTCDRISCPDSQDWEIVFNYNGNGYEDIYLEVTHKPSAQTSSVKFEDVKAGSNLEFGTYNQVSERFLSVMCSVESVQ